MDITDCQAVTSFFHNKGPSRPYFAWPPLWKFYTGAINGVIITAPPARKARNLWDTKIIFWIISLHKSHTNMILVSRYMFLGSTNSMDTFSKLYLGRPSCNPRWQPSDLGFYLFCIQITPISFSWAVGNASSNLKLLVQTLLLMNNTNKNIWCQSAVWIVEYGVMKCKGCDFGFGRIQ